MKDNIYKFLYVVSIFLILVFSVRLVVDYFKYDTRNNSAPFYAIIIVRIIEFIVPSIICYVIAKILKNKYNKEKLC